MTRYLSLYLAAALICFCILPSVAENNRDASYADYLLKNKFYTEARSEFLFQMYASAKPSDKDLFRYKASNALLESGSFSASEKELHNIFNDIKTDATVKKYARFDYLRALYFQKNFSKLQFLSYSYDDKLPGEELLFIWSLISDGNWDVVEKTIEKISSDPVALASFSQNELKKFHDVSNFVSHRPDFETKSPGVAAALSAIFPGAGHLYAGSFTNAIGSFMLNSIFIALTAYSYHIKNYPSAVLCGFLEIGWYAGNIVSAYQDAALFNKGEERIYKKRIIDNFPYSIGYTYAF